MRALVLVDLQNDFMPGGALAVERGDETVEVANRVAPSFDLVIATKDWHPEDHKSFATQHPGKKPGDTVMLHGMEQVLWPVHCVENSEGAALHPGLETDRIEMVFHKGTDRGIDSYSAFFDNGHLKATGLGDYLTAKNVGELYMMGLATDYCVRFSALDAVSLGFDTHVIIDGCRGVELSHGDIEKAVKEMKEAGVRLLDSSAV